MLKKLVPINKKIEKEKCGFLSEFGNLGFSSTSFLSPGFFSGCILSAEFLSWVFVMDLLRTVR